MVERICPACQSANPLDDRFCGKCGGPLERQVLARRGGGALTIAGRSLPVTWRQVGKTAALGAAALVAEAGLIWLRRRLEQPSGETALAKRFATPAKRATASPAESNVVTIVSQRVIQIFQKDDGAVEINDRHVWQRREE
ncbi:MAG: zinc ribbon domain-containing protein [Roseiflexaceae bacterium]|nr:zinc ribbon domain-containing protein [Roseiflexaceae bacterium]